MDEQHINFLGLVQSTMDSKFRISLKSSLRQKNKAPLNLEFFLAACPAENCLVAFLSNHLPFEKDIITKLSPYLALTIMDKSGRILIPNHLRKDTSFEREGPREIHLVGYGAFLEIWPSELFSKENINKEKTPLFDRITRAPAQEPNSP